MSDVRIVRRVSADNFTIIQNCILSDESLSWKAKGVLCYLLSKPKDWAVRVSDIVKKGTDGEAAVRAAIKELREAGYAKLTQVRAEGKVYAWQLTIADSPIFAEKQGKGKLEVENLNQGNRHITNTDSLQSTEIKKEGESADAPPARAFSDAWCSAFEAQFGARYPYNGRDAKAAVEILKTSEPLELVGTALRAWKQVDEKKFWNCVNKSARVCDFAAALPSIRAELVRAISGGVDRKEMKEVVRIKSL